MTPRQCHGMDCINAARVGSKYCSDQCGLTVASLRSVPWYELHHCSPRGQQVPVLLRSVRPQSGLPQVSATVWTASMQPAWAESIGGAKGGRPPLPRAKPPGLQRSPAPPRCGHCSSRTKRSVWIFLSFSPEYEF